MIETKTDELSREQQKALEYLVTVMPPEDASYLYFHSHATFQRVNLTQENLAVVRAYLDLIEEKMNG